MSTQKPSKSDERLDREKFYLEDLSDHKSRVRALLSDAENILVEAGRQHDNSKLSPLEASFYVDPVWELGHNGPKFGTPEHKAITDKMGPGWEHHMQHNAHHIGHHKNGVQDMNLFLLLEMVCDWIAASERRGGKFDFDKSWANASRDKKNDAIRIPDELRSILKNTAEALMKERKE